MKKSIVKIFSVRKVLFLLLLLSILYASVCCYYKIKYWGFTVSPRAVTDVWTIDAKVSFDALGGDVEVGLSVPTTNYSFKILSEEVVAKKYVVEHDKTNSRIVFRGKNKKGKQNLYYRFSIFDDVSDVKGDEMKPIKIERPILSDEEKEQMGKLWELVGLYDGDKVQKVIRAINKEVVNPSMSLVIPLNYTPKEFAEKIINVLAYKRIPARIVRVIKLEEGKKTEKPDIMLEAFFDGKWKIYDLNNANVGLAKNLVVFQRGGVSLLDVRGGEDSKVMFSVLKSVTTPEKMAKHKARDHKLLIPYEYSVYSLPIFEQNTLKWLMIFPLAILVVVLMRNVIGVSTMGTFTPMLLAISLVKTGLIPGVVCFSIMIFFGLLMRAVVARLNLLLVPRISFVVIFVILLIQVLTVVGYKMDSHLISSAIFFPIIITAWIIERASITWEEEGAKNTIKEIFNTVLTALITYVVVSDEYVRHIMFAFNEFNIVIMFIVMLLGTYTGYRLTELMRFAPLVKSEENANV